MSLLSKLLLLLFLLFPLNAFALGTYLDFEEFTVTDDLTPDDSPNWRYTSALTNPCGWSECDGGSFTSKLKQPDGYHWIRRYVRLNSCDTHYVVDTFGFIDISPNGHNGKALRYYVTGGLEGVNSPTCTPNLRGTRYYEKENYSLDKVYTGGASVGHAYLYFKRNDVQGATQDKGPYDISIGANRFWVYVKLPNGTNNGVGGSNNGPGQTFQMGVVNDPLSTQAHEYFNWYTRGGGWAKIQIEETHNGTQTNGNTVYVPNYWDTVLQMYMTTLPYTGQMTTPYEVLFDDITFAEDTYTPQNNETISNISILYKDADKTWEIGFNDKYKNSSYAYSTYEVRYSFSPITNENWALATPIRTIADSRFNIAARTDGKFQKWWPNAQGVWTAFTLTPTDTALLTAGTTVHFAVKDISQVNGNGPTGVQQINTAYPYSSGTDRGGRNYTLYPNFFRYSQDQNALPYIKRISYTLSGASTDNTAPTTTATPVAGTYLPSLSIELSTESGATTYYTLDGSTPTTSSSIYSSPISITSTTTLKFFSRDIAGNNETVQTNLYTIIPEPVDETAPITTASPPAGTYFTTQTVSLNVNETANTYYTTDGSTPTTLSPIYVSPLSITYTTTLKFFSQDTALNNEGVKTATYSIISTPAGHLKVKKGNGKLSGSIQ